MSVTGGGDGDDEVAIPTQNGQDSPGVARAQGITTGKPDGGDRDMDNSMPCSHSRQ